jgi:hypothetical protein
MTQEYTQDEINAILASIEIDDHQIMLDDKHKRISETLLNKPINWRTPEVSAKIAETKRKNPPNSIARAKFGSAKKTYTYFTPKGQFDNLAELNAAYPDIKPVTLYAKLCYNRDGFYRKKIDE